MNRSASQKKSRQIAFGGLSAALSLLFMLSSAIIPISTYAAPLLAGVALLPLGVEFGAKAAFGGYLAVSILSFFLVPDLEAAAMFVGVYGYYPIIHRLLRKLSCRPVRILLKIAIFNLATLSAYAILIYVFQMAAIAEELKGAMGVILLIMANLLLVLYDRMIDVVEFWYRRRLQKRLFGE